MRSLVARSRRGGNRFGNANGLSGLSPALVSFLLAVPVFVTACGRTPPVSGPSSIRLVDLFNAAEIQADQEASAEARPRIEWFFDGPRSSDRGAEGAATSGWVVGGGVTGLEIRDKLLAGHTTDDFPIIHTIIGNEIEDADLVHSVEVRASVTEGANLAVAFQASEKANPDALRGPHARLLSTPLFAGEGMQTYTLRSTNALMVRDLRHILLRPSDVENAHFEVESVRVITLKEHLAETPAGVGWYGLSDIYKESIAAKAPVTARFEVALQERPRLDLAIGAIEDEPVTYRIGLSPTGQGGAEEKILLERTVNIKDRWEPVRVDLAAYAGREVTLTLRVDALQAGAVGFWGSPVLRNSGASPATSRSSLAEGVEPPQGVILIMADSLRRDHLNIYGYDRETAPALARMASKGALFRDCVSQAAWTSASAPSILTSLYPTAHTVLDIGDRLPSAAQTLAEIYREAGYATLSMSSAPSTGQFSNLHQGFETLHESDSLRAEKRTKSAREYMDRLLPWLEDHRDVPFFVFLHVSDPRNPFEPHQPYDSMWAEPAEKEEHEEDLRKVREFITDQTLRSFGMPNREELEKAQIDPGKFITHLRDLYDGSIRGMDEEIGRLLKRLEELGLTGKTIVAFVGDHGEEFLDHGRTFHGHSVYGELTNVPLLLMRPGTIPAGYVVETTVQTIDLMPTLLEMSGLELADDIQGISLLPLIAPTDPASATSWARGPAVTEKAAAGRISSNGEWESYAIIIDGWKLIHNTQRVEGQQEFELYNHREDPLDQVNVAADNPDLVERLGTELAGWQERALSSKLSSDAQAMSGASSEELERLEALGYL